MSSVTPPPLSPPPGSTLLAFRSEWPGGGEKDLKEWGELCSPHSLAPRPPLLPHPPPARPRRPVDLGGGGPPRGSGRGAPLSPARPHRRPRAGGRPAGGRRRAD